MAVFPDEHASDEELRRLEDEVLEGRDGEERSGFEEEVAADEGDSPLAASFAEAASPTAPRRDSRDRPVTGAPATGGAAKGGRELPSPLYRLRATHSNETFFGYWEGEGELAPRSWVVAPTRYGRDVCELQGLVRCPGHVGQEDIFKIDRRATEADLAKARANEELERKAFELCRQKIEARKLPMKLVAAHYLLEEPKVLFFFSAESRVDFRELVKDLVAVFKMRIELRQIGVRDEARVTGGCGVCGRVLCCHGVSDKLTPVSIKMAKDQNLSLNSMKISGPCGRLLCCLAYEYGFYRDARRELPGEGVRFFYDGVLFRVIEVNALSGSVKAAGEDGRVLDFPAARFVHSEGKWKVREELPEQGRT